MKRLAIFFSLLAVIVAALLAFTNTAGAAVYDNGGPDYGSATLSDFTVMQEIGDDFILDASANVTDFHWWGGYFIPPAQLSHYRRYR